MPRYNFFRYKLFNERKSCMTKTAKELQKEGLLYDVFDKELAAIKDRTYGLVNELSHISALDKENALDLVNNNIVIKEKKSNYNPRYLNIESIKNELDDLKKTNDIIGSYILFKFK